MGYTLGEAARAAGVSKASIGRAIKSGRLSAGGRDDGNYSIDPAELARVYPDMPVTGDAAGPMRRSDTRDGNGVAVDRDGYRAMAEETIRDLRARLDRAEERIGQLEVERRQLSERLTALLTHRQTGSVPAVPQSAPRPRGWRRWFR